MARKVAVQSFHLHDNTPPNSHNRSTKKTNDMSMSVRDGKILLVVRQPGEESESCDYKWPKG